MVWYYIWTANSNGCCQETKSESTHTHTYMSTQRPERGRKLGKHVDEIKRAKCFFLENPPHLCSPMMLSYDCREVVRFPVHMEQHNNSSFHRDKQPVLPLQEHHEHTGPADSCSQRTMVELLGYSLITHTRGICASPALFMHQLIPMGHDSPPPPTSLSLSLSL